MSTNCSNSFLATSPQPALVFLSGFTEKEQETLVKNLPERTEIANNLSTLVTHVVLKAGATKVRGFCWTACYYAVVSGASLVRKEWLTESSLAGRALDAAKYEYKATDIDISMSNRYGRVNVKEICQLASHFAKCRSENQPRIFSNEVFNKVLIVGSKTVESRQQKKDLRILLEAGGGSIRGDDALNIMKERKPIRPREQVSCILLVNRTDLSQLEIDEDFVRKMLNFRIPILFAEFLTESIREKICPDEPRLLIHSVTYWMNDHKPSIDFSPQAFEWIVEGKGQPEVLYKNSPAGTSSRPMSRRPPVSDPDIQIVHDTFIKRRSFSLQPSAQIEVIEPEKKPTPVGSTAKEEKKPHVVSEPMRSNSLRPAVVLASAASTSQPSATSAQHSAGTSQSLASAAHSSASTAQSTASAAQHPAGTSKPPATTLQPPVSSTVDDVFDFDSMVGIVDLMASDMGLKKTVAKSWKGCKEHLRSDIQKAIAITDFKRSETPYESTRRFTQIVSLIGSQEPGTQVHDMICLDAVTFIRHSLHHSFLPDVESLAQMMHEMALPEYGHQFNTADSVYRLVSSVLHRFPPSNYVGRFYWLQVFSTVPVPKQAPKKNARAPLPGVQLQKRVLSFREKLINSFSGGGTNKNLMEVLLQLLEMDLVTVQDSDVFDPEGEAQPECVELSETLDDLALSSQLDRNGTASYVPDPVAKELIGVPLAYLFFYDYSEKRKRGLDANAIKSALAVVEFMVISSKKPFIVDRCSRFLSVCLEALRWFVAQSGARVSPELQIDVDRILRQFINNDWTKEDLLVLFPFDWIQQFIIAHQY